MFFQDKWAFLAISLSLSLSPSLFLSYPLCSLSLSYFLSEWYAPGIGYIRIRTRGKKNFGKLQQSLYMTLGAYTSESVWRALYMLSNHGNPRNAIKRAYLPVALSLFRSIVVCKGGRETILLSGACSSLSAYCIYALALLPSIHTRARVKRKYIRSESTHHVYMCSTTTPYILWA